MAEMTPNDHLVLSIRNLLTGMKFLENHLKPVSDQEKHTQLTILGMIQTVGDVEKHIERLTGTDYDSVKNKLESLKKEK